MKKGLVILLSLITLTAHAEIRSVNNLTAIQEEVKTCDTMSLVLLDIGGTLLVPKDAVFHPEYQEWTRTWIHNHYPHLTHEDVVKCTRIFESTKEAWRVVNPAWKDLLDFGESQGIKIIAFTKVHMDKNLVGTRALNLAKHGLNMRDCLPELKTSNTFAYKDGVIETGEDLKGPVLADILMQLSYKPHKIIFVDDRREQVQSIEETCQNAGIACVAFHYTEAKDNPPVFTEKNAVYQLQMLFEEGKWASEDNISLTEKTG